MDKTRDIVHFLEEERREAEKACKKERFKVSINPNSYIAKEIKFQTALLKDIQWRLRNIEMRISQKKAENPPLESDV